MVISWELLYVIVNLFGFNICTGNAQNFEKVGENELDHSCALCTKGCYDFMYHNEE